MEEINTNDLYNELLSLDKKIRRLQKEKQEYFLNFVDERDKSGEIKVPLVVVNDKSDYKKLDEEKKTIKSLIENNERYINKFSFYLQGKIWDLKNEGLSDEEINTRTGKEKNTYIKRVAELADRLKMIDENPKLFLRICECERCDYSKVNNKKAICVLKNYDKRIKQCRKERESVKELLNIHFNKDKNSEKYDKASLNLKLCENRKKRS